MQSTVRLLLFSIRPRQETQCLQSAADSEIVYHPFSLPDETLDVFFSKPALERLIEKAGWGEDVGNEKPRMDLIPEAWGC